MELKQLRTRLDETSARTALVRGSSAPPRPSETVTVAPGVSRAVGVADGPGPLFVTSETGEGRTDREFDGRDARAAADHAARLVAERDPRAAWLRERDQIRAWWGRGTAAMLERRLAEAARDADARLVVWTNEECVAVKDRYDVVLDP